MRRLVLLLLVLGLPLGLPLGCADEPLTDVPFSPTTTIHVSPWGTTLGDGSASRPAASLEQGYQLAIRTGADTVLVAAGEYDEEQVILFGGFHLIGGCDPVTWVPDPSALSRFPHLRAPVLANDIRIPTTVRNLDFSCEFAIPYANNLLGLLVLSCSADLHFTRCRFATGDGPRRPQQDPPEPPLDLVLAAPSGGEPICGEAAPGAGGVSHPVRYSGRGGEGGHPGEAGQDGGIGFDELDGEPGAGGAPGQDGQNGQDGQDGQDGQNGQLADPLPLLERFSLDWPAGPRPTAGDDGGYGGGGGGGGGGSDTGGNGGGAGGRGGPSGRYRRNGDNGGCSIGALIHNSPARFTECHFQAGNGGDGANGVSGTRGAAGAPGGSGGASCLPGVGRGGDGGHGGHGGSAGGSAGGHGGHSIAIWIVGQPEPTFDEPCTHLFGQGGGGGRGGQHGNGLSRAPDGQNGMACKILRTDGFSLKSAPASR